MVVATIKDLVVGKKIMLFGPTGMLGHALLDVFPQSLPVPHSIADIIDIDMLRKIIEKERPAIVINAAAYTDVDGCEDNPEYAYAVNGKGPGNLAEVCQDVGAILIHFSSDYVFEGTLAGYSETAQPSPINIYGISKQMGEDAIMRKNDDYRIIRTSWLYGSHGKNFIDTIRSLSEKMDQVRVVNDQVGKPTYAVDLALKTREIISSNPGIYHITNDGICSWFEFASACIPNAVPCTTAEFPRKARRPARSVLLNTKTLPLRHWREALAEYLKTKTC
jgi:dTDP-4-dehydrorhamnose reductase